MAEVKLDLPADLLKLLQGMGDVEQTIKECIVLELYRRGEIFSDKFFVPPSVRIEVLENNHPIGFWKSNRS